MSRRFLSQLENSSVLLIVGICSVYATDAIFVNDPSPNRGGNRARAPLRVALPEGQITHGVGPVLPAKIFRFAPPPNQSYNSRHPAPMRGAYRDRHGRWARDAMDAAASGARGVAGRISVSDQPARRRPALKRLRQNFGRQHMSRSKGFGRGSRVRQRRVVLAPVAGVKLMEICRAQPGFGESSIRQRRWQEEFVAGESAL